MKATDMQNIDSIIAGTENDIREFVITLGQSDKSKGVMFVLYSVLKKVTSPYVNPLTYLGILGDDIETACINARKRIKNYRISVWDEETIRSRKEAIRSNPESLIIDFGKYKGLTVSELYEKDVDYLFWLANNGNFKSKYMAAAMEQYREICKENIISRNRDMSLPALSAEGKATVKVLTITSLYAESSENPYSGRMQLYFKVKLIDVYGNRYSYSGTSNVFDCKGKGDEVEFKSRITRSYEAMGITYNVLKIR